MDFTENIPDEVEDLHTFDEPDILRINDSYDRGKEMFWLLNALFPGTSVYTSDCIYDDGSHWGSYYYEVHEKMYDAGKMTLFCYDYEGEDFFEEDGEKERTHITFPSAEDDIADLIDLVEELLDESIEDQNETLTNMLKELQHRLEVKDYPWKDLSTGNAEANGQSDEKLFRDQFVESDISIEVSGCHYATTELGKAQETIEKLLSDEGAIVHSSVVKKPGYLVVGKGLKHITKKLEKALELKDAGIAVHIISEEMVLSALNNKK